MTFSIVACDPERGDWGVAVASRFPAVGAVVPWARAGVGAVATQAHANVEYGPEGLALLGAGATADDAVRSLIAADEGRAQRQLGIVDASGRSASFTGEDAAAIANQMQAEGVIIRPLEAWGAPKSIRITIGTPEQNKTFLKVFTRVTAKKAALK